MHYVQPLVKTFFFKLFSVRNDLFLNEITEGMNALRVP